MAKWGAARRVLAGCVMVVVVLGMDTNCFLKRLVQRDPPDVVVCVVLFRAYWCEPDLQSAAELVYAFACML